MLLNGSITKHQMVVLYRNRYTRLNTHGGLDGMIGRRAVSRLGNATLRAHRNMRELMELFLPGRVVLHMLLNSARRVDFEDDMRRNVITVARDAGG